MKNLNIGMAVELLKQGLRVRRTGWNGKGMWLHLVKPWTFTDGKNDNFECLPFVCMKTADDKSVPWLCSQTDLLAEDWEEAV
jgi:hypothetical protein